MLPCLPSLTDGSASPVGTTARPQTRACSPLAATNTSNSIVTVTATPDPGWTFLRWLGEAIGTNATSSVVMRRDSCVEAVFGTGLSTIAVGGGSVLLEPNVPLHPYGTVVR